MSGTPAGVHRHPCAEAGDLLSGLYLALARLAEELEDTAQHMIHGQDESPDVLRKRLELLRRRIGTIEVLRARFPDADGGDGLEPLLRASETIETDPAQMPVRSLVLARLVRQRILQKKHDLCAGPQRAGSEAA